MNKCPIKPRDCYKVLRLDEDDNTFKATLLDPRSPSEWVNWTIVESRVLYDQAHIIYDFHTVNNDGIMVNYVLIRDEGLLAYIDENSEFECLIRPFKGYSVLRLDDDKNNFIATLLSFNDNIYITYEESKVKYTITESRVLYDHTHLVYDFRNNDNDYVIIRSEGLLAEIGDEAAFILGDK